MLEDFLDQLLDQIFKENEALLQKLVFLRSLSDLTLQLRELQSLLFAFLVHLLEQIVEGFVLFVQLLRIEVQLVHLKDLLLIVPFEDLHLVLHVHVVILKVPKQSQVFIELFQTLETPSLSFPHHLSYQVIELTSFGSPFL